MYLALQGNIGLGKAIDYFTSKQIPVALPLNDTQKYDLIADFDGKLQRISVKTCRNKSEYETYAVMLRNCGGSSGQSKSRPFDNTSCDYVFILTSDNKLYLIPASIITATNTICVGKKYIEYEVKIQPFSEFVANLEDQPNG